MSFTPTTFMDFITRLFQIYPDSLIMFFIDDILVYSKIRVNIYIFYEWCYKYLRRINYFASIEI